MSTAECIASANDLLAAHAALLNRVRTNQRAHRRQLRQLPSPPQLILNVPLIPSPQPSPPPSRSPSPNLPPKPMPYRPDLPAAKRARMARYDNYVPEEETIRNDYSQRYVDGGEWPQDWVLGADPERRFEECVLLASPLLCCAARSSSAAAVLGYVFPGEPFGTTFRCPECPSRKDVLYLCPALMERACFCALWL